MFKIKISMFRMIICVLVVAFSFWAVSRVYKILNETSGLRDEGAGANAESVYVSEKDLYDALSQ
jgi:hypothetical protein